MSNAGSATRRGVLRTPAVASVIGAVVGLGLLSIAPPPAEATSGRPDDQATSGRPDIEATSGRPEIEATGGRPDDQATSGRPEIEATGGRPDDQAANSRPDDGRGNATIAGVVVGVDGRRHLGVIVQLHRAATDDEPEQPLRPAFTGIDGRYRFDELAAGCYRVVVDAPAGTSFAGGSGTEDQLACLADDEAEAELRSVTIPEGGAARSTSTVEIVHVGHHLGRLAPSTMNLQLAGATVETEIGGWPRVVTAIDAASPADAPESTIIVNTGGVLAGSELAHLFGGAADAALLNQACFDYLAPSPEDRARADEWATFVRFLDDDHCPTTVLDPGAARAGGVSSTDPAVALHPVGATTVALVAVGSGPGSGGPSDPVAATRARIEELAGADPAAIVVLSGLGLSADRELAERLPAIDAIVGSGSDSLLGDIDDLGLTTLGPYPDRAVNADGDPVCLGHAGAGAKAIGVLQVEVDATGRVVGCGGRIELLVGRHLAVGSGDQEVDGGDASTARAATVASPSRSDIDEAVADHPALEAVTPDRSANRSLARWSGVLDVLLDDPVANATEDRCHTGVPGRSVGFLCGAAGQVADTPAPRHDVQQLVADAFRHRAGLLGRPAIALIDSDTVHGSIDAGPLTAVEAYRLLPTGPTLTTVELTGAELATVIGERLATAVDDGPGAYPHASGLRFTADLSRPGREAVGPIEVLDDGGAWQPIDEASRYRVVVTDRLLAEATGSPILARAAASGDATTRTTVGTAEALLDYVDDVLGGVIEPGPPLADRAQS